MERQRSDNIGLYNPGNGTFYIKNSFTPGNADATFRYGPANNSGWEPLVGDWDGDGDDAIGLYNPGNGVFYLKNSFTPGNADSTFRYGPAPSGWTPLSGSWEGSAATRQALPASLGALGRDRSRPLPTRGVRVLSRWSLPQGALPDWVQAQLNALGMDLNAITSAQLAANQHWLIVETTQALQTNDANGVSDLYRIDLLSDQIQLISATEQGQAGNGASRYPSADASGELIVFHSEADDLVAGDNNQVSDIFLRDLALGQTERLTDADGASAHPGIDATGTDVVYDQRDAKRDIGIVSSDAMGSSDDETLSLAADDAGLRIDAHHPAISADGRFVAYLEQASSTEGSDCRVHLYDRATEVYHRQVCPEPLATAANSIRPSFSPEADVVRWHLPGQVVPVVLNNPLAEPRPVAP